MTRRALLVVAFCGAALLLAAPARAEGEVATELTIQPLQRVSIGSEVPVVVDLRLAAGGPLGDQPVQLSLDGEHVRRVRTEADGTARFRLPRDLVPGEYAIEVQYPGQTDDYLPAVAMVALEVVPFELEIETVPPLSGTVFTLDGERFEAGADGIARIQVEIPGEHQLAVLDDEHGHADLVAEFSRWNTELFGPEITISIPRSKPLQAGFDVWLPANQAFVDLEGSPVDPARITSITLRSSLGNIFTHPDGSERLYKASRAVRRPNGLESVVVRYSVDAVEVDGSNVVNSGQQRFTIGPGEPPWEIELLLYSARIEPRDALLGFGAGTAVEVTFPNGKVELVEADEQGEIAVRWLARGIYRMTVADAPGWAPGVPVVLSRDQEVELRVVSYVDMALVTLLALVVSVGLLHRGRPHLIPGAAGTITRGLRVLQPAFLRQALAMSHARAVGDASGDGHDMLTQPGPDTIDETPLTTMAAVQVTAVVPAPGGGSEAEGQMAERPPPSAAAPRGGATNGTRPTRTRATTARGQGQKRARGASASRPAANAPSEALSATEQGSKTRRRPARASARVEAADAASQPDGSKGEQRTTGASKAACGRTKAERDETGAGASGRRERAARSKRDSTKKATPATRKAGRGKSTATTTRRQARSSRSNSARAMASAAAARQSQLERLGLTDLPVSGQLDPPVNGKLDRAAQPEVPPVGLQSCPGCGLSLWVEARFCRRCGRALHPSDGNVGTTHETALPGTSIRDTTRADLQPPRSNGREPHEREEVGGLPPSKERSS